MRADLDVLCISVYCTADDLLPARPGNGRRKLTASSCAPIGVESHLPMRGRPPTSTSTNPAPPRRGRRADKGFWGRAYNERMECTEVRLLTQAHPPRSQQVRRFTASKSGAPPAPSRTDLYSHEYDTRSLPTQTRGPTPSTRSMAS